MLNQVAGGINAVPNGRSKLWLASREGHLGTVRELLGRGAPIDAADVEGRTPLWVASEKGRLEVVLELFRGGAAIDAASKNGPTPLWISS